AAINRIIADGHELASHTRTHGSLNNKDEATVRTEIFGVEQDSVDNLGSSPRITLFRAPYGEPYQWVFQGDPNGDSSTYHVVSGVAAERAEHIGRHIDSDDWRCKNMPIPGLSDGACFSQQ